MRECDWCHGPIAPGARRDSITCSKRCRQARARFIAAVGSGSRDTSAPLRLAYADPPYPGLASYYANHPDYAGEVDHAELIRRLCSDFDGWALSTNARSLQYVLALCPPDVAVASWHRGERPARAGRPLNGWEPVIYWGGRIDPDLSPLDRDDVSQVDPDDVSPEVLHDAYPSQSGSARRIDPSQPGRRDTSRPRSATPPRRVDVLEYFSRPRLADPDRVIGGKPATFARWMFDLLGARPQDDFTDLYPGSGGILRAWRAYSAPTDTPALAGVTPTERTPDDAPPHPAP